VYIIPENYWLFFASSNVGICMGYIQAKNRGSHAKEGPKDIEKYTYSESEIRPIKLIF